MQKLTNEGYSAKSSALDNFCIGHWVVTDKFIGNSDSPIGWQQAKNFEENLTETVDWYYNVFTQKTS